MNRAERRKETFRVIKQRKRKLKAYQHNSDDSLCYGKLKNNNEMNAFRYTKKKTNWKKNDMQIGEQILDMVLVWIGRNTINNN